MARLIAVSHMGRYREVTRVLAEEGLSALAVGLDLPGAHLRHDHATTPDATMPERLRRAMERLGPTAVKVGQMLSTRPDLLPEEYRLELRRLQDEVAPVPYEDIALIIEEDLGGPPDEVFATFAREPLASASIGQVHAATLPDGTEVVVKVQRPGIRAVVETDLDILRAQARKLERANVPPETVDIVAVADEFADAVRRELDYLTEAGNVDRFEAAFDESSGVVIPHAHPEYTTRRVLTLDRIFGVPFNRPDLLDEAGYDRHELANTGVRAYLTQIFRLGFFHADPHPGNIFAMSEGRIGFTDFGRVGVVNPGIGDAATDLLEGIVDRDADLATDALVGVSSSPARLDIDLLRREISNLIGKYHGTELGAIPVGALVEDMLDLVRLHRLGLPSGFVVLMATLAILEGVGRDLDPTFDFVEVARPYADQLAREQFRPAELSRKLLRTGRRLVRTLTDLPSSVDRALRRVAEGEFSIAVRPEGYDGLVSRLEELVDRLSFSVIIAAFVIGFSLLLTLESLPTWLHVVFFLGMLGAVGVAAWMFASIFLARWRGRRRS